MPLLAADSMKRSDILIVGDFRFPGGIRGRRPRVAGAAVD
jgi:hypothetical protein